MSLLLNLDSNKIGDRGCRYISEGVWPQVKGVEMRIIQNISGRCGVREEGCRAIAKQKWHLEWIDCILTVTQVMTTKSEWPAPTS